MVAGAIAEARVHRLRQLFAHTQIFGRVCTTTTSFFGRIFSCTSCFEIDWINQGVSLLATVDCGFYDSVAARGSGFFIAETKSVIDFRVIANYYWFFGLVLFFLVFGFEHR